MLLYIFDIQLIILSHAMQFFGQFRHLERWQPIRNFQYRLMESYTTSRLFSVIKKHAAMMLNYK